MKQGFILLLMFLFTNVCFAETAEEIVNKAEEQLKGKTAHGTFTMKVVTPDFTRVVTMESWNDGNEYALIIIKSPKKEVGNKTLKRKNEMWTYLKNTETTMKLPASMLLQSWNGSDLTNDDLVRESNMVDDYNLKLVGSEKINKQDCWKVELKPKPKAPVSWAKLYYWIRKSDNLPAQIKFYDQKGTLHRTMKFSDFKKMGGRKTATKWTIISEKKKNHYTEFIYNDVEFDIKIPRSKFSFRELER